MKANVGKIRTFSTLHLVSFSLSFGGCFALLTASKALQLASEDFVIPIYRTTKQGSECLD